MPTRPQKDKALGLPELLAIALGGMIGGGIFTILGISVTMVGVYAPLAIGLGGIIALLAAYSYVRLALYYMDEGATYAFVKKSYPRQPFAASLIGWWVIFGYISTIALYAYTFASYAISSTAYAQDDTVRKLVALAVIWVFTAVNLWSVRGMGRIEDIMVYTKVIILAVISAVLLAHGGADLPTLVASSPQFSVLNLLIVASVTFVAFEGFQLVINATNDMTHPKRNIPHAIYWAIAIAAAVYVIIATGAILSIPFADIIKNKEFALAAGARDTLGVWGNVLVILGALLATMSAISGTLFGASHQLAAIAEDGYMPATLTRRSGGIPKRAIIVMAIGASSLVMAGSLRVILEFGSVTFLLVSFLMAVTNHRMRRKTGSKDILTVLAMLTLLGGTGFILYYEAVHAPEQLAFILGIYAILTLGAWLFAHTRKKPRAGPQNHRGAG